MANQYGVPTMLTINQTAQKTGLSPSLLRRLCKQGKIIFISAGNRTLINYDKLLSYLNGENINDQL